MCPALQYHTVWIVAACFECCLWSLRSVDLLEIFSTDRAWSTFADCCWCCYRRGCSNNTAQILAALCRMNAISYAPHNAHEYCISFMSRSQCGSFVRCLWWEQAHWGRLSMGRSLMHRFDDPFKESGLYNYIRTAYWTERTRRLTKTESQNKRALESSEMLQAMWRHIVEVETHSRVGLWPSDLLTFWPGQHNNVDIIALYDCHSTVIISILSMAVKI